MADKVEHSFQSQNVHLHQEIKHNLPTGDNEGEYFQLQLEPNQNGGLNRVTSSQ